LRFANASTRIKVPEGFEAVAAPIQARGFLPASSRRGTGPIDPNLAKLLAGDGRNEI
jgi:hypothetical protein